MSWREVLPVHPAALLFPRMSEGQLRELADDICGHGLRQKVDLIQCPGGKVAVLDGINRLDALELLGQKIFEQDGAPSKEVFNDAHHLGKRKTAVFRNATAFVISANIARRHLNQKQKRELAAMLLALDPERSDRQVAKTVGVDHKTVSAVRSEAEAAGEIPHHASRVGADGVSQPAKKVRPRDADNIGAQKLESAWERVSPGARALFMR